jgi:hypothetical protein
MQRFIFLTLAVLSAAFISGCGQNPHAPQAPASAPSGVNQPISENPPSSGDTPEPPTTPGPTSTTQNFSISAIGLQSSQTQIETLNLLKVTLVPKSNTNADYGCISFKINVSGTIIQTGVLRVDGVDSGNCPSAPTSFQQDFSNLLLSGSNTIDISVSAQQNDHFCYANGIRCPIFQVGSNDEAQSQLTVETNAP